MTLVDRILLGAAAAALVGGAVAAWLLAGPSPTATATPTLTMADPEPSATPVFEPSAPADELVVDVEGAVMEPGIHRLPPGSRIADGIAAAGGYAHDADLEVAARQLNLAAPLSDGEQIVVPAIGMEPVAAPAPGGATGGGSAAGSPGGAVNVNTATPEQLQALPGIGPVTAQKIVAGREERPFASLEEMVERKAINRGQLESIRELAVAP